MQTLQIGDEWHTERAGGLNSYYFELLRHLSSLGTGVHGLVVGSDQVRKASEGHVIAFAPTQASLSTRILSARRMALRLLVDNKIDLIASHFALYAMPIIDRLNAVPTVVHFHGPWAAESSASGASAYATRLKSGLERNVYARARRLIVLSEAFKKVLINGYGVAEDRIRVVPGGIDIDRFNMLRSRSEARRKLGWPTDRPIILSVRRQVQRMGLENLIDAAKLLRAQCPDILIFLGGTGPLANELQQRIDALRLAEHVKRLGRIEDADLPDSYRAADVTVVPSQTLEGFGLITLESLASGTPVYVTPVGGLPEIVKPFAPQCVFADSSAAEIAGVLGKALRGEQPVPSDQACRQFAAENFAWPCIAKQVHAVYEQAIA